MVEELEKLARSMPGLWWTGTPFSPGRIRMPQEQLDRMGLTERSHPTRDAFNRQFSRYLVDATPSGMIPVLALNPGESRPELDAFEKVERFLPVLVKGPESMPHTLSRVKSALFDLSPRIAARSVEVRLEDLPAMFTALGEDPFFGGEKA